MRAHRPKGRWRRRTLATALLLLVGSACSTGSGSSSTVQPGPATTTEGGSTPATSTTLVVDEVKAANWRMEQSADGEATHLPIGVSGGGCDTSTGTEMLTEIVRVDVVEHEDTVEIAAWVRWRPFTGTTCAGIGIFLPVEVVLASPLGDRTLVNSGVIPREAVSRCQGIWGAGGDNPCSPPVVAP